MWISSVHHWKQLKDIFNEFVFPEEQVVDERFYNAVECHFKKSRSTWKFWLAKLLRIH